MLAVFHLKHENLAIVTSTGGKKHQTPTNWRVAWFRSMVSIWNNLLWVIGRWWVNSYSYVSFVELVITHIIYIWYMSRRQISLSLRVTLPPSCAAILNHLGKDYVSSQYNRKEETEGSLKMKVRMCTGLMYIFGALATSLFIQRMEVPLYHMIVITLPWMTFRYW